MSFEVDDQIELGGLPVSAREPAPGEVLRGVEITAKPANPAIRMASRVPSSPGFEHPDAAVQMQE
jgi:hypothetical protein